MKYLLPFVFLLSLFSLNAQHQDKVDFIRGEVFIELEPKQKKIRGEVIYQFNILRDVDSIFLDAKNMQIQSVSLGLDTIPYNNDHKRLTIHRKFKQGENHLLILNYTCTPKQTVYFLGWNDAIPNNEQIWTQGQGKYTSHWLPSFDDMEEKIEFDLKFSLDSTDPTVIANGLEFNKGATILHTNRRLVSFDMQKPMSSYLLAFAIGKYKKQELKSKSGIPIQNYYYPQDSLKVEPTYRYTKEIFDFLEEEIDFPYPWQNYKQIPVHDFLYAGMENTTATIFSDGYVIDSTAFIDKNYVNVNAHELAHQWFGNLVTEKDSNHHWLHEGFATYYAYLAEQHLFGDDHFYWKLFNTAKELQKISDEGLGQALTDPKASSSTFYEKGAWALVMLKDKIGGEAFKKGIAAFLNTYQFKNVTIEGFLKEMEEASQVNLDDFEVKWLNSTEFSTEDVKNFLMTKNSSIRMFYVSKHLNLSQRNGMHNVPTSTDFLKEEEPEEYKMALLEEFKEELNNLDLLVASSNPSLKVRQKAIRLLGDIPNNPDLLSVMQPVFEKLLTDESYVTVENALFKLWTSYPEEKAKYLEQTKDVIGLPNKNVRLLWLTLAILTNDYDGRNTQVYFMELSSYTSKEYGWEIRMGAFQYLNQALGLDQESLRNLVDATNHHSWQFKKFARNLVDELLKDADYEVRLLEIAKELKGEELRYMNTKLNKE